MTDILIVDDTADIADLLEDLLTDRGYHVRRAQDGEEGLRELSRERPDLVLLDVEMPVLDGPGMAYQMFLRDCGLDEIPIVLLSGIVDLSRVARRVGTPYFLAKPYSRAAIIALCEKALTDRVPPHPQLAPAKPEVDHPRS